MPIRHRDLPTHPAASPYRALDVASRDAIAATQTANEARYGRPAAASAVATGPARTPAEVNAANARHWRR